MKTYSVKEVAELLKANPETVRRWIRDGKLEAAMESKKTGHVIHEAALRQFLQNSPRYASNIKSSAAEMAAVATVAIGGLVAQKLIDNNQLGKPKVSNDELRRFLHSEIARLEDSVKAKENTVLQLKSQIENERNTIAEYQGILDNTAAEK